MTACLATCNTFPTYMLALQKVALDHTPLPRVRKDSKSALISVVGGQLSKDQVIAQLHRIFTGNWKWELTDLEENT